MSNQKKETYYVRNQDLLEEIRKYKETGKWSDELGRMIIKIVNGIARRPNFSGYSYLEDMKGEAYINICKGLKNFDPEISQNPFSYITTSAWNAFIAFIKKEKNKSKTKNRLYEMKDTLDNDEYTHKAINYTIFKGE